MRQESYGKRRPATKIIYANCLLAWFAVASLPVANLQAAPLPVVGPSVKLNAPLQAGQNVDAYLISKDNKWVVYTANQERMQVLELFSRPIAGSGAPIKMNGTLVAGGNVED